MGVEVPHSPEAEQALLGAMLLSDEAILVGLDYVTGQDFYNPWHQRVFSAVVELFSTGHGVDPVTVKDRLDTTGGDSRGADLVALQAACPTYGEANVRTYAGVVAEAAGKRRYIALAEQVIHQATNGSTDLATIRSDTLVNVDAIAIAGEDAQDEALYGDDFIEQYNTPYDWLVKGLLERQDRCIVVAPEGHGKSTLLRQFGIMAAQGVHPFLLDRVPPIKVLYIDLENPSRHVARKIREITAQVKRQVGDRFDQHRFKVWSRPGGLDVVGRRDDRNKMVGTIKRFRPDLVCIGPLYKLAGGDPKDEQVARAVAMILDDVRQRFDSALMIETHAPHKAAGETRAIRPFGASLWLRWPEFGLALIPDAKDHNVYRVGHWRGARDERPWPTKLKRGQVWPWEVEELPSAAF